MTSSIGINNLSWADLIGILIGLALTLAVFSYIFGDNPLFRIAIQLFIGVSAGYALVVAWRLILWPQLFRPMFEGSLELPDWLLLIPPLIFILLLFTKLFPSVARWGSPSVAFLVGVGMAAAVGGAIQGTIIPQVIISTQVLDAPQIQGFYQPIWARYLNGVIILVGTLGGLFYFRFTRKPGELHHEQVGWQDVLAWVGNITMVTALGVLFAGVLITALSAMSERIYFIVSTIQSLIGW